jgi:AraC-like DNA-binding protein
MDTVLRLRERLRRLGAAARAAEQLAQDAREGRDAEIEQADVAGLGIRQIATDVGMSPSRVQRIVLERTAARQAGQARAVGLGQGPVGDAS